MPRYHIPHQHVWHELTHPPSRTRTHALTLTHSHAPTRLVLAPAGRSTPGQDAEYISPQRSTGRRCRSRHICPRHAHVCGWCCRKILPSLQRTGALCLVESRQRTTVRATQRSLDLSPLILSLKVVKMPGRLFAKLQPQ